jgi:galactonate dehydratase
VYGWIGGDIPANVLEEAKARKEQGFTVVKMLATGPIGWLDSPSALDDTVKRLELVKSTGLDCALHVNLARFFFAFYVVLISPFRDFHGRLHKPMARQLARRLEPLQPFFIEEPLLPFQVKEIQQIHDQTTIPIAVRSVVSPYPIPEFLLTPFLLLTARRTRLQPPRIPPIL